MPQTGPLEIGKKLLKEAAAENVLKSADKHFEMAPAPLGCCILKLGNSTTSQSGVNFRQCKSAADQIHSQYDFREGQQCP